MHARGLWYSTAGVSRGEDDTLGSVFRVQQPRSGGAPVVVEIPHAGTVLPDETAGVTCADLATRERDADRYVDELYANAASHGATVIVAELSRYVVDLNREVDAIDDRTVEGVAAHGAPFPRGVIWRETSDGRAALVRRLTRAEYAARIEGYYRPYHQALGETLARIHARYGYVVLVSGHSMPSSGKDVPGMRSVRRADVVPGTRGGSTAAPRWIHAVDMHFRAAGLRVVHDDPYRGGATTARWGRPTEGFHAIQVELNRSLYMDEHTGERRTDRFTWVASLCGSLVARLAEATARGT